MRAVLEFDNPLVPPNHCQKHQGTSRLHPASILNERVSVALKFRDLFQISSEIGYRGQSDTFVRQRTDTPGASACFGFRCYLFSSL